MKSGRKGDNKVSEEGRRTSKVRERGTGQEVNTDRNTN